MEGNRTRNLYLEAGTFWHIFHGTEFHDLPRSTPRRNDKQPVFMRLFAGFGCILKRCSAEQRNPRIFSFRRVLPGFGKNFKLGHEQ